MGIFQRADSKYWWLWLETAPAGQQKVKTAILIGTTAAQRKDAALLADNVYHQEMNAIAAGVHQLAGARPQIRFTAYAAWYRTHTTVHRAGARREGELLDRLTAFFGDDRLTTIDRARVAEYQTSRRPRAGARTINREVDLLKSMLRDAVPKYLAASPLVGMKRLRKVPPVRRYVTPQEFARLLAVCEDAQDTALLVLGRDGLARQGDLLDLQHADRDRQNPRLLHIRDPKGGAAYQMGLTRRAAAAVDALADNGSPYLFPKFRTAQPAHWAAAVRSRLATLCRKADLRYGMKQHGVTFHWGTRRSGATDYLMTQKKTLKGVQLLGNWKHPQVLLDIYTEATQDDMLAVVDAPRGRKRA